MAEFDQYAERYKEIHNRNLSVAGETSDFFDEHKVLELKALLDARNVQGPLKVLDFGCGIGKSYQHLKRHLTNVEYTGIDASTASVDAARNANQVSQFHAFDGNRIPFADASFDVVFVACVIHHIPPDQRVNIFNEMRRVLKPGGFVFAFEHNPWNPLTQYIVKTCEFDDDAVLVSQPRLRVLFKAAGFRAVERSYVLFLPKSLRAKWGGFEEKLRWLPIGAQYWIVAHK